MTIPPNIGWEGVSVKALGGTQTRTLAQYFGAGIVNVKERGAVGDDTTDDSGAIQDAIDEAFASGPDHPEDYKVLYFPTGTYKIGTPLRLYNVNGGFIRGDGMMSSQFSWNLGSAGSFVGNAYTGDGTTPMLLCENVSNTRFEGFSFLGSALNQSDLTSVAIYFYCSDGGECRRNMLWNISIGDLAVGVQLGGADIDQIVTDHLLMSVQVAHAYLTGIRVDSAASIGHVILGAGNYDSGHQPNAPGGSNSTYAPGSSVGNAAGGYASINGQISILCALSVGGNTATIYNASKWPMCVFGMREEANIWWDSGIVSTNSPDYGGSAGPVYVANYVTNGWSTYWHHSDGVDGNNRPNIPLGRRRTQCLDAFEGGRFHSVGQLTGVGTANGETGNILLVDATSSAIMDCLSSYGNDTGRHASFGSPTGENVGFFEGEGTVYLMGVEDTDDESSNVHGGWWPVTNTIFSGVSFAGNFVQVSNPPTVFARDGVSRGVPPAAPYKGTRFLLTDSTLAATAGNYWTTVTVGGSSNVTPIFSDGTNWRIA